ncbi:MAG: SemiSWEET family transporter [Chloroflexota bacterium]
MEWYVVGSVAALLTSLGFAPQVVKMWRTRAVRDVSPITFLQFIVGSILWTLYGVNARDPIIIAANIVSLAIVIAGLLLYLRFARAIKAHR